MLPIIRLWGRPEAHLHTPHPAASLEVKQPRMGPSHQSLMMQRPFVEGWPRRGPSPPPGLILLHLLAFWEAALPRKAPSPAHLTVPLSERYGPVRAAATQLRRDPSLRQLHLHRAGRQSGVAACALRWRALRAPPCTLR